MSDGIIEGDDLLFQTAYKDLGPKRVELNKQVFEFLKKNPDTEGAYFSMEDNLKKLFDYIEVRANK